VILAVIIDKSKKENKKNKGNYYFKLLELAERLLLISDMNKIPFKNLRFDKKGGQNLIVGKGFIILKNRSNICCFFWFL
jgi:hypothetical protein